MSDSPEKATVGRVLDGRYQLTRHLADGGMGSVWEARHLALETAVAMKLIREPRPDWIRRFRRESKVVAQLSSPYVVRVFDYGVDDGTPYFVMELLHGVSMADHLHAVEGPLTPAVTARLMRQLANGLAEAHGRGIVHRDLKPQNIWLLEGAGGLVAKILDFGLATTTATDVSAGGESLSGTPRYMSPEQYDASAIVDHRSDLWALAVITYECITGEPAYAETSIGALLMAITHGAPRVPSEVAQVPAGFDAWYARAAHRDSSERFQSATEAAEALSAICEPERVGVGALSGPRADATGPVYHPPSVSPLPDVRQLRTNLVSVRSSFVGRDSDLLRLARLVEGGKRLITLLGPGGSGKTRLAQEFGHTQVPAFAGGVWFIDLTAAQDVMAMQNSVSLALEIAVGAGDVATQLGYAIAGRGPTLLIFDNFEQIADRASPLITRWCEVAPDAVFLITSRERLRVDGETVADVDPQLPDDAVRLFEERAQAVAPQFTVDGSNRAAVGEIVERLDRLPLAIELAAARMRLLSLAQLSERLAERFRLLRGRRRDQGARQSTMRGAIDWSWALLTPAEKLVFVQLSVFHGGFQFEAVDAVVELTALEDAPWPDEIVESLAEKSLVRARDSVTGARRFFLLESMRAYAVEKLGAVDAIPEVADLARLAAGCRQRHRDHYGTLGASNVASSLYIPGGAERRALLRLEQDNLDIAITTGLADGDGPGAARAWLARFWGVTEPRGPYRPAADRAAAILTLGGLSASLRARLDLGAGTAYRLCGVRDLAFAHCDAALPLARDANDHGLCTAIMRERGTILLSGGDLAAARASFDAAIEIARAYGLRRLEGIALGARAEVFFWEGDLRGALEGYDAAAAHLHAVGERRFFAGAVANRAIIEHELGELAPARAGYQVALTFLRRMANRRGESDILANVALIDQAEGRFEAAIRGQEAALLIDREGGNRPGQAIRFANLGITLLRMGRNAEAEIRLNESLALADGAPSPVVGSAYVHRGLVAARRRDFAAAEADLAAGEELLRMTSKTELAKATCVRGEIAVLAGDEAAARAALDAARAVADSIAVNPRSELSRSIVALESAISPPGAKTGETQ